MTPVSRFLLGDPPGPTPDMRTIPYFQIWKSLTYLTDLRRGAQTLEQEIDTSET